MWLRTSVVLLALAAGAAGCVSERSGMQDVPRDESGAVIDGGTVGSQKVRVGDCFDDVTEGQLESVTVVPCDEPHVYEAYHQFDVERDEHPGSAVIEDLARERCLGTFEDFVGLPYSESVYAISYFFPTVDTWENLDDRRVLCLVVRVDEAQTTGTARDAAE